LDAITALLPANIDLLVQKPLGFSVYTQIKSWIHKTKYHGWQNWIQICNGNAAVI
jgi:hypothetical protein